MTIPELYEIYLQHPIVTTDSRRCPPDSLFFALKGDRFDGNDFAEKALESGCSYAIVDNDAVALKNSEKMILVEDTLKTLQDLARHHRETLEIPVIAITGTNGKTTTKELTAAVLSQQYKTLFTEGNLNNHIGVPLTLLRLTAEHEFAVIEMGANHQGEIAALCEIARPDYGLITNVGQAHLEGFGSFEGVIRAKGELYDFIRENGMLVFVNQENKYLIQMAWGMDICPYGETMKDYTFIAGKETDRALFLAFEWFHDFGEIYHVKTCFIGGYNLWNALAAISIGMYFNVEPELINKAIEEYKPANFRSQYLKTNDNELIIDTYNANPDSMGAALENFAYMDVDGKAVILGDMLELGDKSAELHEDILKQVGNYRFDKVLLCGENFAAVGKNFEVFETVEKLSEYLKNEPLKGFHILLKGSHGVRLEKIIDLL
ncbi:MAG: UDP-N-acetylmuramoyl-tripeptide--D-alanyl-D-alanine ligase [Tannerella sp.]|jgi:UDP-N-acetylmuramoyl-tripeptide--D-alanyl-D-alanine ligase|nr:UDP-N-acetylmuramoyl-tripeptide--D-alanyl-D-alanine ligase [Tannerella sp.]